MSDLIPAQADRLAAIEAAPDAPESLRERVARAIYEADPLAGDLPWRRVPARERLILRGMAAAAIAVITEDARS